MNAADLATAEGRTKALTPVLLVRHNQATIVFPGRRMELFLVE
jgi:hypothetical protein